MIEGITIGRNMYCKRTALKGDVSGQQLLSGQCLKALTQPELAALELFRSGYLAAADLRGKSSARKGVKKLVSRGLVEVCGYNNLGGAVATTIWGGGSGYRFTDRIYK